jgi:peptidoglycan hydrolase-like protein with peptidoglycan-binding domain
MKRAIFCICFVLIGTAASLRADEKIRQAQEELRKRNLYFGNVDGQESAELASALKRYQTRKGFAVTGSVDNETATSLHIQPPLASEGVVLPDVPVLRSDAARELSGPQRVALEKAADENPDPSATPLSPAEPPAPGQDLTPARVTKLVEDYLRDAETDDVAAQTNYFAYPLTYFDHGQVNREFVLKDVGYYLKNWPQRKYTLHQPVSFFASGNESETLVEFVIAYDVRNKKRTASGRTRNRWTLRPEGGELKIVAIREERLLTNK